MHGDQAPSMADPACLCYFSGMASNAPRRVTVDEFLAFEGDGDTRYQLVRGVITAMAPAREAHAELVIRLGGRLAGQLTPPCRVLADAGIKPAGRDDTFWQADLVVTCRPREPGRLYQTEPFLIIELLSPSTAAVDRTLKLDDYRAMASVGDILLVATDRASIEHWRRAGDLWHVRNLGPGDLLTIDALGITIALDDLYADIPLGERST
jgi:Uma2 family endonuclease